jgi:hypothetical protein
VGSEKKFKLEGANRAKIFKFSRFCPSAAPNVKKVPNGGLVQEKSPFSAAVSGAI